MANDLNPLLAGPLLRRVEPARVCIWAATTGPTAARAEIYRVRGREGIQRVGGGDAETVQLGRRLYIHLIVAIPDADGFPTDELLGYDVEVGGRRLADLGLLGGPDRISYGRLPMPTFFIRQALATLHLMHGSCRLLHGKGEDAFVAADEVMSRGAEDLGRRPAVLFLTGDQIYGDEVGGPLVRHLTDFGRRLIGDDDEISVPGIPPLSRVPVYGRQNLANERTRFTSAKAHNHLMSFGEFAATYLTSWNENNWPVALPRAEDAVGRAGDRKRYARELVEVDNARRTIPAVRRVLANIPTYMIFDDHDVTDDWNLTSEWRRNVQRSPAGRRIVANALAAFWAFQGWGNDPDAYDDAFKKTLSGFLTRNGSGDGDEFDALLWSFDRWSFHVPTDPPTVVLDTRTRREFDSSRGAPRLIRDDERDRIERLARAAGHRPGRLLLLVSPVPIFGLELQERRQKFLVGKVGPYEIDFEAWHSNLQGFVDFMRFLIHDLELTNCVLLSGDVHYGINVEATFSSGANTLTFKQLVSSSFKHSGALSKMGIDMLGRLVRKEHERLGWDRPPETAQSSRVMKRVASRAANTDEWSEDAPVFLAPKVARRLGVEQQPDYREFRSYVLPAGPKSSMLVGENNVGVLSIAEGELIHRLLARSPGETHTFSVTMPLED